MKDISGKADNICKYKQFQKDGTVLQCELDSEHDFDSGKDHKFTIPIKVGYMELSSWCSFCITGGQSYDGDIYECSCPWDGSLEDKLFVNCPKCFKDFSNDEIENHCCFNCKIVIQYAYPIPRITN